MNKHYITVNGQLHTRISKHHYTYAVVVYVLKSNTWKVARWCSSLALAQKAATALRDVFQPVTFVVPTFGVLNVTICPNELIDHQAAMLEYNRQVDKLNDSQMYGTLKYQGAWKRISKGESIFA